MIPAHILMVSPKNESSQIALLGHDVTPQKMYVTFHNGGNYEYDNIPVGMFEQIRDAGSAGSTFASTVKKFQRSILTGSCETCVAPVLAIHSKRERAHLFHWSSHFMPPSIIGLAGLKGSGKSTLAGRIPGPKIVLPFAEGIKNGLAGMGVSPEYLHNPDLKEVKQDILCGHSARYAMVTLGTEWGRYIMGPDFWLNMWKEKVSQYHHPFTVICDDVRFPNEVSAIRDLGGVVVAIQRPGVGGPLPPFWKFWASRTHESELLRFDDLKIPVITNDGTPEDLLGKFRAVYNRES